MSGGKKSSKKQSGTSPELHVPNNGQRKASAASAGPINGKAATLELTIDSNYAHGFHEVQKFVWDRLAAFHYTDDSTYGVKLALEEALINAIKHGNRLDPKKRVHVKAIVTPRKVDIVIEDEGPGFDRANVPDPTLEENLEKSSGRGILLIESFMDHVEWSHGGRRLHMWRSNGVTQPRHSATA